MASATSPLAEEAEARARGQRRVAAFRAQVLDRHIFPPTAAEGGGPQYELDEDRLRGWVDSRREQASWAAAALARCLRYISFAQWHAALETALAGFLRALPPDHDYILYVPAVIGVSARCKSNRWASHHALRLLDRRPPADVCTGKTVGDLLHRLGPQRVRHILVVDDAVYSGQQMDLVLRHMVSEDLLAPWRLGSPEYLSKLFPRWWRSQGRSGSGSGSGSGATPTAETAQQYGDGPVHVHVATGYCTSIGAGRLSRMEERSLRGSGVVLHLHAGGHLATLAEQLGGEQRAEDILQTVGVYGAGVRIPFVYMQFKVADRASIADEIFRHITGSNVHAPARGCRFASRGEACPPTFYHRMPGCPKDDKTWVAPEAPEPNL